VHGPEHWGSLDPGFSVCSSGSEQSPIDLTGAETEALSEIGFDYAPSPISILNDGHTIQVDYQAGSGIALDGMRYELVRFHFHHRSEHTVDGADFPLEMHLVHASADGALAVVGVFLAEGGANEALAPVFGQMPEESGPAAMVEGTVDAAALLPERRTTWRYRGSLTTPPCSEGVSWLVMTEPLTASREQIEAFRTLFPVNNRPVQPLNARRLVTDGR
jgi:carbonic anhydrase